MSGGLFALTKEEAALLTEAWWFEHWFAAHYQTKNCASPLCESLAERLRVWLERHEEAPK